MQDINSVTLTGNLTRDSELTYAASGTAVVKFSVAVNKKFKDQEKVSFIDCIIFGKFGEAINQYLTRGKSIAVAGELDQNRWEDQTSGQKRSRIQVIVSGVKLGGESNGQKSQPRQSEQPAETSTEDDFPTSFEDDIPF